jgi:hypothetical protein
MNYYISDLLRFFETVGVHDAKLKITARAVDAPFLPNNQSLIPHSADEQPSMRPSKRH